jgi:hypothetical protein
MPLLRGGSKYTIWGKVVASPKSGPWWILWVRGRPWLFLAPKVLQPCANQLVCWFCANLLKWVNFLSLFLVPSRSSSTPFYPSKCWKLGSVPWVPNLSIVSILRLNLNLWKDFGARHFWCKNKSWANTESQDSPQSKLGGSHHLPPYIILCAWPQDQHPNVILSRECRNFQN